VTLWEKYNPGRSLAETLRHCSGIATLQAEEGELFAVLKRHLTRRELKSFVLHRSGKTSEAVGRELGCDGETAATLYERALEKLRRPVLAAALRCVSNAKDKT